MSTECLRWPGDLTDGVEKEKEKNPGSFGSRGISFLAALSRVVSRVTDDAAVSGRRERALAVGTRPKVIQSDSLDDVRALSH